MTDAAAWQPTLDGLTLPQESRASGMERAARVTIQRLDELHLLDVADTLTVQLVLELASAIGKGVVNGRASAVAMAAKELREALATLPVVPRGGDAFDALVQAMVDAAAAETP